MVKYESFNKKLLIYFLINLVPSSPPENPKCDVMSSTSIYITWSPPNVENQNGKIKGYKVNFVPSDEYYDREASTATTTNQYYTIEKARKYTNYTISILAFTSVGDGAKTKEMFCITNEDCNYLTLND
jgi:hypothetical protein